MNVVPTELVSLRDKVSAWWRPSTGFVSLRDMFCPRRGMGGAVGNAVSTELVSLRDKASIVVVAPYGAVTPVEHTSSLYPPVQIRTGHE